MAETKQALLVLEDGRSFRGRSWGARGEACGEMVFNTSMSGYQEVLTDPSYAGQVVCMTYPLIGNYGVNREDEESGRPWVEGFVVREASSVSSERQFDANALASRTTNPSTHGRADSSSSRFTP